MKTKVMVALDKLKNPNCGLGRVSLDFSQALVHLNDPDLDLCFLVYGGSEALLPENQCVKKLYAYNRMVPLSLNRFQVFHSLHQLPAYKAKGAGKTLITIHDLNFLHTKGKAKANKYLRRVQHNVDLADVLVFVSAYTRETCLAHLDIPDWKRTMVIYNGVALPHVKPVQPGFYKEGPFLFSIGQFLSKKNFHVLIPFLKRLPVEISLVIAGECHTAYGHRVRKLIAESGLQNRILLCGPVTEAEKLFLYNRCTAFVFPSVAEGFGLPVIEAMRSGKPVFTSDQTSLKEIGNTHAHYWHSFDPEHMAQVYSTGMQEFTDQKRKDALDYSLRFTWEENARQYIQLYKTLQA